MENYIMEQFKKKISCENEIIVSIDPESWEEERSCVVMEQKDDGKVWHVECSKNGEIISVIEIS